MKYAKSALKLSKELKDPYSEANSLISVGDCYFNQGLYHESLNWYQTADNIISGNKWERMKFEILVNYTNVYNRLSKFELAEAGYLECIKLSRKLQLKTSLVVSYNNLGLQYLSLDKFSKALLYLKKARSISERIGFNSATCSIENNLGLLLFNIGDYASAIESLKRTIKLAKQIQSIFDYILGLSNLAITYSALRKHKTALSLMNKVLGILRSSLKNNYFLSYGNAYYSLILHNSNASALSVKLADEAIIMAEETENYSALVLACIVNAKNYFKLKMYDEALKYSNKALDYLSYKTETTIEDLFHVHIKLLLQKHKEEAALSYLETAYNHIQMKVSELRGVPRLRRIYLNKTSVKDIINRYKVSTANRKKWNQD